MEILRSAGKDSEEDTTSLKTGENTLSVSSVIIFSRQVVNGLMRMAPSVVFVVP